LAGRRIGRTLFVIELHDNAMDRPLLSGFELKRTQRAPKRRRLPKPFRRPRGYVNASARRGEGRQAQGYDECEKREDADWVHSLASIARRTGERLKIV